MTVPRRHREWTRLAILALVLLGLIAAQPVHANTTFDLLRMDLSPRGAALGNHSLALMDSSLDAAAVHPAGLAGLSGPMVSASYADHPLDVAGGVFSYGRPLSFGYAAVSLAYLNYGEFTSRASLDAPSAEESSFSPNDLMIGVSLARALPHGLSAGATARFVRGEIDNYSSTAVATDLSVHWDTGYQMVELAAGITALGTQLSSYGDTKEDLPTAAHLGVAKKLEHLPLQLSLSGHADADDTYWGTLAGEFTVSPLLKLRVAYSSLSADYEVGGSDDTLAGISAGLGVTVNRIRLDYAFHSQGALGQVHRLGATYTL